MKTWTRKGDAVGLRVVLIPVSVAVAVCAGPFPSSASSEQETPNIEFTLTRVFGVSPDGKWIVYPVSGGVSIT